MKNKQYKKIIIKIVIVVIVALCAMLAFLGFKSNLNNVLQKEDNLTTELSKSISSRYLEVNKQFKKINDGNNDKELKQIYKEYSNFVVDYLKANAYIDYYDNNKELQQKLLNNDFSMLRIYLDTKEEEAVVPILMEDSLAGQLIENNLEPLQNADTANLQTRIKMNEIRLMELLLTKNTVSLGNNKTIAVNSLLHQPLGFKTIKLNLDGDKDAKAYQIIKATGLLFNSEPNVSKEQYQLKK